MRGGGDEREVRFGMVTSRNHLGESVNELPVFLNFPEPWPWTGSTFPGIGGSLGVNYQLGRK
jgi:hypothetical protein